MDVATLIDGNHAIGGPPNPHFKEMFQYTETFHLKFLGQLQLPICNISSVLAGNEQTIHPKPNIDVALRVNIKAGVGSRSNKANFNEESMDPLVPNACCLFNAINRLQQSAYEVPLHPSPHKSFRSFHIDLLIQYSKQIWPDEVHPSHRSSTARVQQAQR